MTYLLIFLMFSTLCADGPVLPSKQDINAFVPTLSYLRKKPAAKKAAATKKRATSTIKKTIKKEAPIFVSREVRKVLDAQYQYPEILQKKITLALKSTDIVDAIELIGRTAKINFVIDSGVSGQVKNINLNNVSVASAIKSILANNEPALALKRENGIYRILPLNKVVKNLNQRIDELNKSNFEKAKKTLQHANLDKALKTRVEKMWKGITGEDYRKDGVYLIFDDESKKLFMRGHPRQVNEMLAYLNDIDVKVPQVKIEARVVIARDDFEDNFGLQLSGIYNRRSSIKKGMGIVGGGPLADIKNIPAEQSGGLMDWALNLFPDSGLVARKIHFPIVMGGNDLNSRRLNLVLNAAENRGELKTILKPSILTNHGEESEILVGDSVPIETIVKENVEGTLRDVTTATYKDVGTKLKVKPTVAPSSKEVTLDIFVENSSHTMQNKFPLISSAKTKCRVKLKNGQTGMIGGLIEKSKKKNSTATPGLKDIPVLGNFFKGSHKEVKNHQLLIFITPTIIA